MRTKKTKAKPKTNPKKTMIKKVYNKENISTITTATTEGKLHKKIKWNTDGNRAIITVKGLTEISFIGENKDNLRFEVLMDKKGAAWLAEIEKKEKLDITEDNIKTSIFKSVSLDNIKYGGYMALEKNIDVFMEICKDIEALGIKNVGFQSTIIPDVHTAVMDDLTLIFTPPTTNGQPTNTYKTEFENKYSTLTGFNKPNSGGEPIVTIKGETVTQLERDKLEFGRYYPERNLILIWINPFENADLRTATSYKDNAYLKSILEDIFKAIKDAGAKKYETKNFKIKILVNSFNTTTQTRVNELKSRQTTLHTNLTSHEHTLNTIYEELKSTGQQIASLTLLNEDAITSFIKEIDKTKKSKLVEKIELNHGQVHITFKPTTVKAPLNRKMSDDPQADIREMYIGRITAHISGHGVITVSSDAPLKTENTTGCPHPHAVRSGTPCLGSGDGSKMIHQLIGERRFSEWVYVFWMWIKKWRPEDCHANPVQYYDDRLKHGYPVFDHTGKRIKINDQSRIKNGEQMRLTPAKDMETNLKKFKDFPSQP